MKTLRSEKSRPLGNLAIRATSALLFLTASIASAQAALTPNPAAAKTKVAMCIGCHGIAGYQSSFPEVHKVPMIAGQNAKYIVAALTAYQKGERRHPTMKGIAASLSEQDILDLAAFYETQGKDLPPKPAKHTSPSAEVAALLQRGNCLSCHGEGLNKPIDASYPKLAGQHGDYLYVALKSYQVEGKGQIGRSNAIMAAQVKGFTHAELKKMAYYIEGLGGDLKTGQQQGTKLRSKPAFSHND